MSELPPNSYVKYLTFNVIVLESGDFGEVIGGRPLLNPFIIPYKKRPEILLLLPCDKQMIATSNDLDYSMKL